MQPPREVWLDNEGNEVPPPEEYLDSELKSIDSSESTSVMTDSVVGNPEDLIEKQNDSTMSEEEWGDDSEDWDD